MRCVFLYSDLNQYSPKADFVFRYFSTVEYLSVISIKNLKRGRIHYRYSWTGKVESFGWEGELSLPIKNRDLRRGLIGYDKVYYCEDFLSLWSLPMEMIDYSLYKNIIFYKRNERKSDIDRVLVDWSYRAGFSARDMRLIDRLTKLPIQLQFRVEKKRARMLRRMFPSVGILCYEEANYDLKRFAEAGVLFDAEDTLSYIDFSADHLIIFSFSSFFEDVLLLKEDRIDMIVKTE